MHVAPPQTGGHGKHAWRNGSIPSAAHVSLLIELAAILLVAYGSAEAFFGVSRVMIIRAGTVQKRAIWMRYAQWLIAGLTFQLAADVVGTTVAPSWTQIGRVAAVAVIRTFLTYFLDRDVDSQLELERDKVEARP